MKKISIHILTLILLFTFFSCGKESVDVQNLEVFKANLFNVQKEIYDLTAFDSREKLKVGNTFSDSNTKLYNSEQVKFQEIDQSFFSIVTQGIEEFGQEIVDNILLENIIVISEAFIETVDQKIILSAKATLRATPCYDGFASKMNGATAGYGICLIGTKGNLFGAGLCTTAYVSAVANAEYYYDRCMKTTYGLSGG